MLDATYLPDGTAIVTDSGNDNVRYVVWQDTDAEDPRGWIEPEHAQTLVYGTSYRGTVDDIETDAASGVMRAFGRVLDESGDDSRALMIAQRYARVFAPHLSIDTYSARGYAQSDWWNVVSVVADGYGTPDSHSSVWEQWARGDVYTVMLETLQSHDCACSDELHDDAPDVWAPVTDQGIDSLILGGIYADDAEGAVSAYLDQS